MARNARLLSLAFAAVVACLIAAGLSSAKTPTGTLIDYWDGKTWTQQPVPGGEGLLGVTALSVTDVWAVGQFTGSSNVPFAVHWDGSTWQQVAVPKPRGAGATLNSVAAAAADDVWAVGLSFPGNGLGRQLVEHWNGSDWQIVPSPHVRMDSWLQDVAVLSPRDAWAVGGYSVYPNGQTCCVKERRRTLIEHWDGTHWQIVPSPNPSSANPKGALQYDDLYAVAAESAHSIWAVGDSFYRAPSGRHSYQTLVLHWNGRSWKRVPSPNPGGVRRADFLYAVAAAGPNDLWAVGSHQTGHGSALPLAERWDGHGWHVVSTPPGDRLSANQELDAVAPGAAGEFWAVGSVIDNSLDTVGQTLAEHWDGTSWTRVATPEAQTRGGLFFGLASLPNGDVWAVGYAASQ